MLDRALANMRGETSTPIGRILRISSESPPKTEIASRNSPKQDEKRKP
jgi:hypothetical protein